MSYNRTNTDELWKLFFKYVDKMDSSIGAEYRLADATMANAIARLIAARMH